MEAVFTSNLKRDKAAKLYNRMAAVPIASFDSERDDLKAFTELEGEVNIPELEASILNRRWQEMQNQEKKLAKAKINDRPFKELSSERVTELLNYWHMPIAQCAIEELARRELLRFTKHTYAGYIANWHHIEYAKKLDAFARGEIKKLMVLMPPQHGKSELCSRRLPAKMLGNNPNLRIGIASYNHKFASKFNLSVQRIIDSDEYRNLFPETTLSGAGNRADNGTFLRNADEFEIVNHSGSLISTGINGGLTGRALDILIIDDPYKDQKSAWSPIQRKSVNEWYDTVADTRLHNNSQQLLTLTRWHPEDLAGHLLSLEGDEWVVLKFSGLKDGPPLPYDPRQTGEALWPEMHSKSKLESAKKRNSYTFNALYQQDPKPAEGLLFPPDSLNWFTSEDIVDMEFDTIVAVSDVADKGSDYYCMPIGGVKGERIYFLDVVYTQEPVKITIPLTLGKLKEWRPAKHRIESNNGGSIFAHTIRTQKTTSTTIEEKTTSTNKETRILMASGQVQEFCYFREDYAPGSQYEEYISDLTSYLLAGGNEHDDAPDATTMMVELVHPSKPETTIVILGDAEDEKPTENQSIFKKIMGRLSNSRSDKWF